MSEHGYVVRQQQLTSTVSAEQTVGADGMRLELRTPQHTITIAGATPDELAACWLQIQHAFEELTRQLTPAFEQLASHLSKIAPPAKTTRELRRIRSTNLPPADPRLHGAPFAQRGRR